MKKYLTLAAFAALVLAACAKIETSVPNAEKNAIGFSTYSPKSLKADADNYVAENSLIADAQFDVYAWSTPNGTAFNGSNGTKFFDWYTVTYKTGGNTDGTKNAYPDGYRYWPSGDTPDSLHFYAYYPSNAGTITAPAAGLGAFSFTAEAAAADQVDFMVADLVAGQTYDHTNSGVSGTVALTFRHQLTRVQFKFKTTQDVIDNGTTVAVKDVKLYNIKKAGTLTSSYNGTAFNTEWSAQGTPATYEVFVAGADIDSLVLTATAAPATNNAADIFLMVPQEMVTPQFSATPHVPANLTNAAQYIVVEWDVVTDGITTHNSKALFFDTDLKTTDNITAPEAALDLDWAKNASITYTLTIGPKPILFTATAEAWAAETNGFFNVN